MTCRPSPTGGLNQYTDIIPQGGPAASITHDMNGNISTDHRGQTYEYDAENRLDRVRDAGGASLLRLLPWADGTMRYSFSNGAASRYYFDGDQEIIETDNAGGAQLANNNIIRRYIRLPGSVDEPLLMIDYALDAACTITSYATCEVWAHQNRLGSVVATTDNTGP